MTERDIYTGPCRHPDCDELFVAVPMLTLARHLQVHFGWAEDDPDTLVEGTRMVIRTQEQNDIDPWGESDE